MTQKNTLPHLIVTRLGLGFSQPMSFRRRALMMLTTLYPSLAAQTYRDFHWVVVTEHLIDSETRSLVLSKFAQHPNFHLKEMNSFENGTMHPSFAELANEYLGKHKDVLHTRVDDDDAFAVDFVERVQACLGATEGLAVLNIRHGLLMHPASGRIARRDVPSGSVGQTFRVPESHLRRHMHGHKGAHEKVMGLGGKSFILDADEPCWLSVLYEFSDSRALNTKGDITRGLAKQSSDLLSATVLKRFGLSEDTCQTLQRIVEEHPEARAPMNDVRLRRIAVKKEYLAMAAETRKALNTATTDESRAASQRRIDALRAAYYAF